jgi:hypothetical protein
MSSKIENKKYLVFAGYTYGETLARRYYVSFKELVDLYGVDIKDCVDMSQVLNQIGLDVYSERYLKLYPHRLKEDYILPEEA